MKAVDRDAKRERARANPREMQEPDKPKVLCYVCATEMPLLKRAQGGICSNCMGKARAQRDAVRLNRDEHAKVAKVVAKRHAEGHLDWRPRSRRQARIRALSLKAKREAKA